MMRVMAFDIDAAIQAPLGTQPGLRPLAPGAVQLTPTVAPQRGHARHLREKLAVLSCFANQALVARPGFDPTPALDALAVHAAREHPSVLAVAGRSVQALALGWSLDADGRPASLGSAWPEVGVCLAALPVGWRRAALLGLAFAEDLAIVDGRDASIAWLAVALPSMWAPEHQVGRPAAEVEGPFDGHQRAMAASALTSTETRWERVAWTITRHPRLHAHPRRLDPSPWPGHLQGDALAANAWFRSERQTVIPLPALGQAVLTIRVDVLPLVVALATPDRRVSVRDALASMSPAELVRRDLAPVHERLLHWLDAQA